MRPTSRTTKPLPGTAYDPLYPNRMRPRHMGESDWHRLATMLLYEALEDRFRNSLQSVYVAMNLVFYFQEGNPRGRRNPDVLVAKGVVGNHLRLSYRLWEEGVLPCTLFEIASQNTWKEDIGLKRRLYARLNIPEYFIFDPEDRFLMPALRGFRTVNRRSVEMPYTADGLISEQLGVRLVPEGRMLRLYDLATGQPILTRREQADQDRDRMEQERQRAEQEQQRAEQERQRAEAAEQRIEELAAELARLPQGRLLLARSRNAGEAVASPFRRVAL